MTCSDCKRTDLTVTMVVNYGGGVAFRLCRRCWSETTAPPAPKIAKGRRK